MIPVLLGGQKTLESQIQSITAQMGKIIVEAAESEGTYEMNYTFQEIFDAFRFRDVLFDLGGGTVTKMAIINPTDLTITLPDMTFTADSSDAYPIYTPLGG